jgi:two-component system, chemotaxis family, chemotaxis protein CheY
MPSSVLLIDDSSTIREIVKIYLMGRSLEFVDAENAERALTLLGLMPIKLIIADIKLPGMSGVEFVRKLRKDSRAHIKALPVILLTGQKAAELKTEGLQAGANAFLEKPITSGALIELIDKFLPEAAGPGSHKHMG